MITLAQLQAELKLDTHPSGVPENIDAAYNRLVIEALYVIQKWVRCQQENNSQIYPFCSTYWDCNTTVVPCPRGRIKRVYTVQSDNSCDKVYYQQFSYDRVMALAKQWGLVDAPANAGLPPLDPPLKFSESSTDRPRGRARYGVFAINNERMYAFPPIHSSETLMMDWDGIKRTWASGDLVSEDPEFKRVVRLYVSKEIARTYDNDMAQYQAQGIEYREALQDIIHECNEETRIRKYSIPDVTSFSEDTFRFTESKPAVPMPTGTDVVFANIGDWGTTTQNNPANDTILVNGVPTPILPRDEVFSLVDSWNPTFVTTNGDNFYYTTDIASLMTGRYGKFYSNDPNQNMFWPALGNHEWSDVGIQNWYNFFNLPNNKRYYDFIRAGVHFFIVDSGYDSSQVNQEPDGNTQTSIQAQWLRLSMALSTAKWKVVILHHPPYDSCATTLPPGDPIDTDGTLSYIKVRWPFKSWGADVVFSGHVHFYERLSVDGLTYVVNGAGGAGRANYASTISPFSVFRDNQHYGAVRGTASCNSLKFEFVAIDGTVIDSFTLTKSNTSTGDAVSTTAGDSTP